MTKQLFLLLACLPCVFPLQAQQRDWLIDNTAFRARVETGAAGTITLGNGLLSRSFSLRQNLVCTDYRNLVNGEQLLRAVQPEARVTLNGTTYRVGGLHGQPQQAYLVPAWLDTMKAGAEDFVYTRHTLPAAQPDVQWQPRRWAGNPRQPSFKALDLLFSSRQKDLEGVEITVHYKVYDGIPLLAKSISIRNNSGRPLVVDQVVNEILAAPEEESAVVGSVQQMKVPHGIYVESNYAFNNAMKASLSDQTTHWKTDSSYTSQVNYNYQTPCLLEVYPEQGIHITLQQGGTFRSITTWELLLDSYDRERNGLAQRAMYRTIAPWTTENPIFMHLVTTEPEKVRAAIDQCAATGYEGVILSFGSKLNMEDTSAANISRFRELADYAHGKKILLGGYSLFSSRRISDEDDVIDPATGKPGGAMFGGHAPCLGSKWGIAYLQKIKYFIGRTGFDIFENDGPYPGDLCASTTHPGHKDLHDSQWTQMEQQKKFYRELNAMGVYMNAPDWYFLDGTHKIGLGYREVNFSLPREQQILLNRQNIFDGTWEKTPSMGWGFVPLTQYHGGGAAATLEPLKDHLHAYENLMMQYYGAGIQACYRGPRLYDTDSTKKLVQRVVGWYKQYRPILNADIIHLRRADGRDWDGFMHVSPRLPQKALVMLFNPLPENITREVALPLYYTGLDKIARIRMQEGAARPYALARNYSATVKVTIPAQGYTWLVVE
ncbi:alpha-galactosidase [Chitinophaga alhagiae]|uniref:Alpha-galactosidase n=1 Tax=Chitinophaga alhagiae TaxID=2203219 RepID=A0ABM6WA69_9BACT|nr:alpha-galactosidase [Chitinophaga alhagiae]AWO00782.1 alpha-galactosidase [Chitinophaga alhagiae]